MQGELEAAQREAESLEAPVDDQERPAKIPSEILRVLLQGHSECLSDLGLVQV